MLFELLILFPLLSMTFKFVAMRLDPPRYQFPATPASADNQTYTITLAQYTGSSWGPVYLPDLQLDFTMLDPHIRTSLKQVSSSSSGTTYSASFKAPDRHGVFKFVVEYWRPGYVSIPSVRCGANVQMDIYPIIDQGVCRAFTT